MNISTSFRHWVSKIFLISLPALIPCSVIADETEIFYQNDASKVDANVLFLLDASGSMETVLSDSGGKSRMQVMQEAFRDVMSEAPSNLNIGLMGYANARFINSYQWDSIKGVTFPISPINGDASTILGASSATDNLPDAASGTPVRTFLADIVDSWEPAGYTPIVDSLYEAARYFRGEDVVWGKYPPAYKWAAHPTSYTGSLTCDSPVQVECRQEWGECNGTETACTPKPVSSCCQWVDDSDGGFCVNDDYSCSVDINHCQQTTCSGASGAASYNSPVQYSCQSNFLVLMSDGKPEYPYYTSKTPDGTGQYAKSAAPDHVHDNTVVPALTPAIDSSIITTSIPEMINSVCTDQPQGYASGTCGPELTNYLANNDQSGNFAGDQTVETYTVAFGLGDEPAGTAYLASLATAKNGAYTADNAEELAEAFKNVFGDIQKKSYSFSSPSFSVNEDTLLSHDTSVYVPVFDSSRTPLWSGNLRKFTLNSSGDIVGSNSAAALTATGSFEDNAQDLWSQVAHGSDVKSGGSASKIPSPANRRLKTDAGSNVLVELDSSTSNQVITNEMLSNQTRRTQYNLKDTFNNTTGASGADGWSDSGYYYDCDGVRHDLVHNVDAPVNILDVTTCVEPVSDQRRNTLLNFARGYDAGVIDTAAPGRKHMGDMLNTKPVVVNYGSRSLVLVATNEGYLHAFDTDTGIEEWAFMPSTLLKNQDVFLRNEEEKRHVYGLDGALTLWKYDSNKDGIIKSVDGDKQLLFFGMRRGGRMYYALDITNPGIPTVAWKIAPKAISAQDNSAITSGFSDLGETWSKPTLSKMRIASSSDAAGEMRYVLVFGGGYDPRDLEQDAAQRGSGKDMGADVYIVDALTGERLWSLKGNNVAGASAMVDSIPGDIRVLDMDNNGELDRLYFGDTGGNVWRVDMLPGLGNNSGTISFKNNPRLTKIAELGGVSSDGDNRKFFYEPDTAMRLENGKPVMTISIGSGYRTHPLDIGDNDRFYVLVDDEYVFNPPPVNFTPIEDTDLMSVSALRSTGNSILKSNAHKGWYYPLSLRGEKVLATSLTFLDKVIFTTFAQATADGSPSVVGPCEPLVTTSRAYVLDLLTGQPVANLNREESVDQDGNPVTDNDDFVVAGFGEILDAPQLIFSKLADSQNGACTIGDCQQSVSVRIGKLKVPLIDLNNTNNGENNSFSEMVDLTKLLPHLYWLDETPALLSVGWAIK